MTKIDQIHKLIEELGAEDYEHRKLPEFLELLEAGEKWANDMKDYLGE